MDWPHKDDFNAAPMQNWTTPDAATTVGQLRSSNGFSFLRVYDSGHMVPRDQPQNALAMLNAFISGKI
jgi:cathepsin A (carboxypeptidase C)